MKKYLSAYCMFVLFILLFSCKTTEISTFWDDGKEFLEVQQIFDDERFPNVVVATDGSVVATWGSKNMRVRRSEDGGKTWQQIGRAHV